MSGLRYFHKKAQESGMLGHEVGDILKVKLYEAHLDHNTTNEFSANAGSLDDRGNVLRERTTKKIIGLQRYLHDKGYLNKIRREEGARYTPRGIALKADADLLDDMSRAYRRSGGKKVLIVG